jgi:transposase
MQVNSTFVGVDVAKAELVVVVHSEQCSQAISNEAQAIDAWLAQLPAGAAVAVESTGAYHQLLVQRALYARVPVYVLNAKDVYFYAKALGSRGKTDRSDAAVIARYLAEHHDQLHPWQPASREGEQVMQLLTQRWAVVSKRTALRQALKGCKGLQALGELERAFDALLKEIDERIQQLISSDPALHQSQQMLRTITGFGAQSSALLATLLQRIPFANSDALVAYSGLDPRPNDSGAKRGRRALSKRGSPDLRRQMYLVAFAACHSKALGPLYKALRAKGFQTTEALVILARKLLRVAYAVWKARSPFDLSKIGPRPA